MYIPSRPLPWGRLTLSRVNAALCCLGDNDRERLFFSIDAGLFLSSILVQLAEMQNLPADTDCSALGEG